MTASPQHLACITHPEIDSEILNTVTAVAERHETTVTTVPVGAAGDNVEWDSVDIGIALGGDGTFLEGVRLCSPHSVPLLAVNAGTLGFLARIHPDDLEPALRDALTGEIEFINREMLAVDGAVTGVGINDVMVEPLPLDDPTDRKITTVHAYIDDEYVGEFSGSGVAVSTPTGSTAVAFSAGGPVHYPNANSSLQLTPLQTHNAGVRPVIVDSDTTITLLPETEVTVSIDGGRTHATIASEDELTVTGAERTAKIVRTEYDETFFDAMSGKLGWGIRDVDEPGPLARR